MNNKHVICNLIINYNLTKLVGEVIFLKRQAWMWPFLPLYSNLSKDSIRYIIALEYLSSRFTEVGLGLSLCGTWTNYLSVFVSYQNDIVYVAKIK